MLLAWLHPKLLILSNMLYHTGLNAERAFKLRIELQIGFTLKPAGLFLIISLQMFIAVSSSSSLVDLT